MFKHVSSLHTGAILYYIDREQDFIDFLNPEVSVALHELAGKQAPYTLLENIPRLIASYYSLSPDPENPEHEIRFGTSGHRGTSSRSTFNEHHILAISQALADYRNSHHINGPLLIGMDTHALSEPAFITCIEVLAANDIPILFQEDMGYTPTPVISHAILSRNRSESKQSDGVIVSPSHNPPSDGGFKYNPPNGGPAGTEITNVIQEQANRYLRNELRGIKRISLSNALKQDTIRPYDFILPYVNDLKTIIDMDVIKNSGLRIGADPMGGSGIKYWGPISDIYKLDIDVVNPRVDPTFSFMTVDGDGKIRMDCSSPHAMASLINLKDKYDIAFGNDPDFDRHGIVTPGGGLMNPNHYLSVAVDYLFQNRLNWNHDAAIGKTLVSSSMIDRIADSLERELLEVPVGFKWFTDRLQDGSCGFGGEESAGASFLRMDGSVWTTDKDGIILNLLAAEITARTGKNPYEHYQDLTDKFGNPVYERIDSPASPDEKEILGSLSDDQITAKEMAGEKILRILTRAPGNNAAIGGLKVVTENGWFAARPSGTEDIYKIYAESFRGEDHLKQMQQEAVFIVNQTLGKNK